MKIYGLIAIALLLSNCADLAPEFAGYDQDYYAAQANFDQQQAIERVQWHEDAIVRDQAWQRNMDRLRDGLAP